MNLLKSAILLTTLLSLTCFAEDKADSIVDGTDPSLDFTSPLPGTTEACAQQLVGIALKHYNGPGDFEFLADNGHGMRGFLASVPPVTPETMAVAKPQLVEALGINVVPVQSWEEAQAKEKEFFEKGKSDTFPYRDNVKVVYMVLPNLNAFEALAEELDAKPEMSAFQARGRELWKALIQNAEFGYYDNEHQFHAIDRVDFISRISPSAVSVISADYRGVRYLVRGWVSPKVRGVAIYDNIFAREMKPDQKNVMAPRMIKDKDVRRALKEVIKWILAGGTVTFDHTEAEIEDSIFLAKNQLRAHDKSVDANGVLQRVYHRDARLADEVEERVLRDRFKNGKAYAVNARRSNGRLVATAISLKDGNLFTSDTVGYLIRRDDYTPPSMDVPADHPDKRYYDPDAPGRTYASLARALRLLESAFVMNAVNEDGKKMNIGVRNVMSVSTFTEQGGGERVPFGRYREMHRELRALPPAGVPQGLFDLQKHLPYPISDMKAWLGFSLEELQKEVEKDAQAAAAAP